MTKTLTNFSDVQFRNKLYKAGQLAVSSLLLFCSTSVYAQQHIGSLKDLRNSLKTDDISNGRVSKQKSLQTTSGNLSTLINVNKSEAGADVVIGEVAGQKGSSVYFKFTKSTAEGTVTIPSQKKAYTYRSDASGNVTVEETDINKIVCVNYADDAPEVAEESTPPPAPAPGSPAYNLQSLPGVPYVVYLDFDGQYVPAGSRWNGGNPIDAAAPNVSENDITTIWKHISEDYSPFNVNITTSEAVFLAAPKGQRIRCIFTPTSSWYGNAGGVAYLTSFTYTDDTPCWAFYYSTKVGAEVGSHEIGHTMGLSHDGRSTPAEGYYGGQGNWAPIMGVSYYKPLTQWSKGEYQYATQTQDDLAIIAGTKNKFGYKTDEAGNTNATAKALAISSTGSVQNTNTGIITLRTDIDVYSFTTSGGTVSLTVTPDATSPNLDVLLNLVNSAGTVVATANPTNTYSAAISTNLAAGTYYLQIDGTGYLDPFTTGYSDYASIGQYTISGTVPVSAVNQPPVVSLTAPANNATFTAPATVAIAANATDTDGTVAKVEFFNGTTKLGEDLTSPYTYNWTGVAAGTYSITARATDNSGAVTNSAARTIVVSPPANQAPTVSITSPVNNATFTAPASVTINATAADADGTVTKVEFFNGTTKLGEDLTSPYAYSWTGVVAGTYSITARATDNSGAVTTSAIITVIVNPAANQAPTVSLTAPANNATFTAPATVTINATAADADGTVTKVEFFNGTTKLGEDLTSPYAYSWTSVAAGTYSITARATDNSGAVTNSAARTIVVSPPANQAPTVSITAPANNATFTAPASIAINATAADADGTVTKVEFFNGTTKLGEDLTSPYAYSWTSVAAGTYSITAKATDNSGAVTTSSAITIVVNPVSSCTAPLWNASTAYWANDVVQYNGIKYKANWWTQNNRPDLNNGGTGTGQPWTSQGACGAVPGAIEASATISASFSLAPNPVQHSATVNLSIPEKDNAEIYVVDQYGQKVLTIFSGSIEAGSYQYDLNAVSLGDGIYHLILRSSKKNDAINFIKN